MSKPFDPHALVRLIAAHAARPRDQAQRTGEARAPLDHRDLRQRLVREYADLEAFFATHDAEARATRAHRLAGAAGAVGAHAVHGAALACERALREGAPDATEREVALFAAWRARVADEETARGREE